MILDWLAQALSLLAAAGVLFVPGLVLGLVVRLRGLALFAFAPVVSTAVAGLLALVLPFAGVRWGLLSFAAGVLVLLVPAWALRRWVLVRDPGERAEPRTALLVSALVLGGALIALRLGFYIGAPDAISQTNDAVFHLNALRYISESGSASSLTVSGVLGAESFYPAAWHAMTSLVVDLVGGDLATGIPIAANAMTMAIAAVVWPLSISWLTRVATGSTTTAAVAAALSGAMLHFPILMFEWGVLYPNALALAVLPAGVAIVLSTLRGSEPPRWRRWASAALFAAVAVAALGLAQPVTVLTWAIILTLIAVTEVGLSPGLPRARRLLVPLAAIVSTAALWALMVRVSGAAHWGPYGNWVEALRELVLTAQVDLPPSPVVTALTVVGVIAAWRRRRGVWLIGALGVFAFLMIVVTSVQNPGIRNTLLAPWYADPYRVAATLPIVMVPLMAVGVVWLAGIVRSRLAGPQKGSAPTRAAAVGVPLAAGVVALALWPVVMMPLAPDGLVDEETRYASHDRSYLSPDERTLLTRLGDTVEPGALIIGNPSTGTAFGYALSGANVFPRTWAHPRTEQWELIGEHLRDAGQRDDVCDALHAYGDPQYALDFGLGERTAGRTVWYGMTNLDGVDGFEFVDGEGDATLWRITACQR